MDSIAIEKRVTPPLPGEDDAPTDLGEAKKIDWLFAVRNMYTHRAAYVPGGHPESVPIEMRSAEDWWWMGEDVKPTTTTSYAVRAWPAVLEDAVRAGLLHYVLSRS